MELFRFFILSFFLFISPSTWAVSVNADLPAKVTGEEQEYLVKSIQYSSWTSGLKEETSLNPVPMVRPTVKFSLMSRGYMNNTVKFGNYCLMFTIGGFWSSEKAKAVQEALSHAKNVTLNPQDFQTDRKQKRHNDSVPAHQIEPLKNAASKLSRDMEYKCYKYDVDASKIMIETQEGEKLSLLAEAEKKRKYPLFDEEREATIKGLTSDLKAAQTELEQNQAILSMTGGTAAKAEAKKFVDESFAKVKKLEDLLSAQTGTAASGKANPGSQNPGTVRSKGAQ